MMVRFLRLLDTVDDAVSFVGGGRASARRSDARTTFLGGPVLGTFDDLLRDCGFGILQLLVGICALIIYSSYNIEG